MARATSDAVRFDYGRMAKIVQDARKNGIMIDFSRLICAHFGKLVEWWSAYEGRPVSAHNNKTLFLEAIDIWCRSRLCAPDQTNGSNGSMGFRAAEQNGSWTRDPKDVIEHAMEPWYEAMALDDPSKYRMTRRSAPPAYAGSHEDAIATALGLCACLEVQPLQFRVGMKNGEPAHIWGRIQADRKWYDMDLSRPDFKLGDYMNFDSYEEVEIPL